MQSYTERLRHNPWAIPDDRLVAPGIRYEGVEAEPDLLFVRDRFGYRHRVSRAQFESGKQRLSLYRADGFPRAFADKYVNLSKIAILRENISAVEGPAKIRRRS